MRNFKRPSSDLVRDVINERAELPFSVDASNLIFGKPSGLLEGDDRGDTGVNVRGVENTHYRPSTTRVFYHKLDLGVLFQGAYRARFTALGQSNLYRLLPAINKALGTGFDSSDLEDINIVALGEGDEITLELRAKPTSLAYQGFTRVTFDRRRIMLTDVVDTQVFSDQLTHPDPLLAEHQSAGLLTWGLDFTLIWEDLGVNSRAAWRRGNWYYHSRLQNALSENYGIDNWPDNDTTSSGTGRIARYDTRNVPEANTDFQFVVVQTEIRSNGYLGTAYFHYNQPN